MDPRRQRKPRQGAMIGLAAAAVALLLWLTGILTPWERTTWDWRVRLLARPSAATEKIKVILLDQATLDWGEEVNGWSWLWPREVYAPLIDFCRRGGARSLAFDVLFTEPSQYGVYDDMALGSAMGEQGRFVGAVFLSEQSGQDLTWPENLPRPGAEWRGFEDWRRGAGEAAVASRGSFPIAEIAGGVSLIANVSDLPDPDGVFRRASLFRVFDGAPVPSLGLAAAMIGADGALATPEFQGERLIIGGSSIPVDERGAVLLRYLGPAGTHHTYSAAAVIQSELRILEGGDPVIDPEQFRDCHVFFGYSAPGLLDERTTPISRVCPGVEIHATALDNLLTDSFLRESSQPLVFLVTLLLSLTAGIWIARCQQARQSLPIILVLPPLPILLGLVAYQQGFWWPVVVGEIGIALALAGGVMLNYATEGRQKKFIKQAFKFYLSPQVIERILVDPDQLKLGGERREMTILFSDLQGFTSLSEGLDPVTLTTLLNEYLSDMTDIILESGGTLDKYEGDAFIAFWNAPLPQEDHAGRACRAAVLCQRRLEAQQSRYREIAGKPLRARIGIHTGEVVVGNMGSRQRFDYTVLGDAANLASRLEGANKVFDTNLMISSSTRHKVSGIVLTRELGDLRVVGRNEPVTVYELVGLAGEEPPPTLEPFARALAVCREGRLAEARKLFEALPSDPAAIAYAEECGRKTDGWDGVWNLTRK